MDCIKLSFDENTQKMKMSRSLDYGLYLIKGAQGKQKIHILLSIEYYSLFPTHKSIFLVVKNCIDVKNKANNLAIEAEHLRFSSF